MQEHPRISKNEKKEICRLMDCKKLSPEACMHAVQNERLPLRLVVQVLFFEQVRMATSSAGSNTPDLAGSVRALLPGGSHGSSRSAITNTEDEWDAVPTAEELKALKGELATLRLGAGGGGGRERSGNELNDGPKSNAENVVASKVKGLLMSKKIFSKLGLSKEKLGENSSSNTSESPGSANAEETKSTPSRSRRHSVS